MAAAQDNVPMVELLLHLWNADTTVTSVDGKTARECAIYMDP